MTTERLETTVLDAGAELEQRRALALGGGGPEKVARHHASGRLTARERIELLVDEGSWFELGMLAEPTHRREGVPTTGDAIVTGFGRIDGRKVAIIAIDATILAGTTAPVNMRKQNRVAEWAGRRGIPIVCLSDNDGGRMPDLLGWRFAGVPFDFGSFLQVPAGMPDVPRITAVLGPSFGDAALHAAMGHFVVMRRDASVALSGPPVIKAAIGEEIDADTLGGPGVAAEISGAVHAIVDSEKEALEAVKRFLAYLPDSSVGSPPDAVPTKPEREGDSLAGLVPKEARRAYDMRKVLDGILDAGSMFPWGERYGRSLICALARLDGQAVGVIASQPMQRAGVLDVPALTKEVAFIDLCETFNLPLVFFQDVPGLMIGSDAERQGILAAYEKVVAKLARATVPKITVIVRKAYGGGHIALGGRPVRPDLVLAWPSAEMGFMAAETGVRTVYGRRLETMLAEEGQDVHDEFVASMEAEWAAESAPWEAAANLILDDVIPPAETREVIVAGLDYARGSHATGSATPSR